MVHRIGLGDLGVVDLLRAQIFLQARNRIVRVHVDGVIDLHLQDQVGAAFEVEAQVDAVPNRGQQARAGPVLRNAEDPEHEQHQDPHDDR